MGDIGIDQKETFFVAVKVFLKKNGKFLILKDRFDDWDLPGGRIKKNEFEVSLEKVIARKLSLIDEARANRTSARQSNS
jgi:8-oxo-dGTP pyrophosphatase MutT (NUDIX family)